MFITLLILLGFLVQNAPRLHYVSTAHQAGPVGYRDPIGVVSPNGEWLATAVNRHLYIQRVRGGPRVELMPSDRLKPWITWLPDSAHLAVQEQEAPGIAEWFLVDVPGAGRKPLWKPDAPARRMSQVAWSPDSKKIAGIVSGNELWITDADGNAPRITKSTARLAFPVWVINGEVACLAGNDGRFRVVAPCGDPNARALSDRDTYGPFALSPNADTLYFGSLNDRGALDLWSRRLPDGRSEQLTHFARDTYAPIVSRDGNVIFKTQIFNAQVATASSAGGPSSVLTDFQSETPTWDTTGHLIGMTYGTWRRVVDDAKYPDIAQDLGTINFNEAGSAPASAPATFYASNSEDQGMCWSPNGKWVVFHSHQQRTDDLWVQPSDRSTPPRRITNGGYETGWPRWSPDGKWIAYDSYPSNRSPLSLMYLIPADQTTGMTTAPQQVRLEGFDEDVSAPQWMPDSESLVFEGSGKTPGRKSLYRVSRQGGRPQKILDFASDQTVSGIAVSPDGKWAAYIGQAADGFFQIFRVAISGGAPEQLTFDPTNKTHPAYSPNGRHLAFTLWTYDAQFWMIRP